jgi:4a-hydroxytetrahydrobiopterin dehydratase
MEALRALTGPEIARRLTNLTQWLAADNMVIARTITCKDFAEAIQLINRVALIAESENHHPDIFLHGYKNLTVSLTTHSARGLTEKDFVVAAKIDRIIP